MLSSLGDDFLALAALVATAVALCGALEGKSGKGFYLRAARFSTLIVFALVLAAFVSLLVAFATSDFSLSNVYANSHTSKPLIYKIAAAWGNHEGSMVLWCLVTAAYAAALSLFPPKLEKEMQAKILGVMGGLSAGFLAFTFFTSDPFQPVEPVPAEGLGFNPLLQDPALAIHPPMLYLGTVGFAAGFAFAVAGLAEGKAGREWAHALRPYVLFAWAALTCGIALGSWWAYYELGWGGWWFWDPVENASFVPWLSGTALLHSLIVVERKDTLKIWTVLLALVTFTFSLAGTFLVRSGILTSVHAFALDPARGVFVLLLIAIVSGGALLLFGLRAHRLENAGSFAPVSKESLLALNNVFLFAAAATVFIGTLYPLILQLAGGDSISVGPPYFEAVFTPLMMPLAAFMGLAPFIRTGEDTLRRLWPQLRIIFYISAALALMAFFTVDGKAFRFYLGIFFAAWILITSAVGFIKKQAPFSMALAHAGLAVALAGMVGSSHLSSEEIVLLKPGGEMQLAGRRLHFDDLERIQGPNYQSDRASFTVSGRNGVIATLHPERRYYDIEKKMTGEVAIHWNGISNLYLVLGEPLRANGRLKGWSVRAALHPLQPLVWIGCLLMAVGGLSRLFEARGLRPEARGK